MIEKKIFTCEDCGNTLKMGAKEEGVPECCGQSMKQDLPVCTTTETAEHARSSEPGEPCDDGRSG